MAVRGRPRKSHSRMWAAPKCCREWLLDHCNHVRSERLESRLRVYARGRPKEPNHVNGQNGFTVTTPAQEPRSQAASNQNGFGIVTVGHVAPLRYGRFLSDCQDL